MKTLFEIVQSLLKGVGYYAVKSKWRNRRTLAKWRKEDEEHRELIRKQINAIQGRLLPALVKSGNVTVSLTSHGKRVANFAPYAIYSIFKQSRLPNRVVLNLDKKQWSEENLPDLIKQLQIAGLEINFCVDKGPHTKLLPSLEKFPEDIIITIDDDIFYGNNMLKLLLDEYEKSNKKTVICHESRVIRRDGEGKLLPYSQWTEARKEPNQMPEAGVRSPYGYRGILYPPHIFLEEIFNQEVFGKLCPKADDIWFTIMEIRDKIPVLSLEYKGSSCYDIDRANEFYAAGSDALHFQNAVQGQNDIQLAALKAYYRL